MAANMIVRLTPRDLAACRYWATDRHRTYLDRAAGRVQVTRDVAMPYAGWLALAKILKAEAFSKSGRGRPSKLTDEKAGTRNALHRIQRELNAIEVHPAFRNELVVGSSPVHIPVWPDARKGWVLLPTFSDSMRVFQPQHEDVLVTSRSVTWRPEGGITWWHNVQPAWIDYEVPGLFLDEAEHRGWLDAFED